MLVRLLEIILLFAQVGARTHPPIAHKCKRSYDSYCDGWGPCSPSCGGTRSRTCRLCPQDSGWTVTETCDIICIYGRSDVSGCVCPEWRSGDCCEACRHIDIDHCVPNQQACGGSPDGIKCTRCYDPYYSVGYGKGCEECAAISHCVKRNCTEPSNTKCHECENSDVFFRLTTDGTKCESLCSFNNHTCWPGYCSKGFTKNCLCAKGFRSVLTETETSCQPTQSPEIETCNTMATGPNGEKRMTKSRASSTACKYLDDMYGNYQLTQFSTEMMSSFLLDISSVEKPAFILEEHFGITDATIHIEKKLLNGVNTRLSTYQTLIDKSDSTEANETYRFVGNFYVDEILTNGQALCVVFEAYGGGYLKHVNKSSEIEVVSSPVPYRKIKGSKEICYRFDSAEPEHCLATRSCHTQPITLQRPVTRSQTSTVSFGGWFDPKPAGGIKIQTSGIESYEVTVNEVPSSKGQLTVDYTGIVFTKKVNESESILSMEIELTSDMPRLYSITLEVKDVADNTRQARRFMLYDNTSYIEVSLENHFRVTSASNQSNFTWQNHHNDICLSWKDHFLNRFYIENELLNPIKRSENISGVYEQLSGVLSVFGTPNVYGITKFMCSSSVNGGEFSTEIEIPNFLNQSYCKDFKVKDGQTYTLQVRAIDIANNTLSENRTVHVDRSAPHINSIWLRKDGYHTLFVHHMTDLSTMQLYFEALDPHSGIRNVQWTFGITDVGNVLLTGAIGVKTISDPVCPKNILECYCPNVGKCEFFNYTIPLNRLIEIYKHKGNHNRNYFFTINITNHAFLTSKERIDILVDESPPEPGVIYEGPEDSKDIDYISENSFVVHWHGFIDHESGIRSYRIGLAPRCLGQLELYNFTAVADTMFYAEVPFMETSIRIPANFTGKRYVSIIALNNAMEPSKSVCSDGVLRDLSPPELRNVTLEHASWSEKVFCHKGVAWLFLSSFSKVRLNNTSSCAKLCLQSSSGFENEQILEMLPTKVVRKGDRDTSEYMCRNLQVFRNDTVVYLPNNHIDLRWDIDEDVSQLEDFYVGIGTHPSEVNLPSTYDYQSTARKKQFKRYHEGISSNELFYIFIKIVNKASLQKISILGPILIDETPPLKKRLPDVFITDDEVVIGWENDTFYDMEQAEQISSVYFQFGHDGNAVTPLLHWQLHVSEPCPRFSGGCLKHPLSRLQSVDTDLGFSFYVDVYVYNNAGHVLKVTTETFRLPSRYPPGHAIVYDVDPVLEDNLQDTDIHFTPETMCFRYLGFKHHQSISIEIGVSSENMSDDIVPLTATNVSSIYCLNSTDIKFDTTYYAIVRASCSGGFTTSFSNGVKILNEDYLMRNLKVELGQDCSNSSSSSILVPSIQKMSSEITFTFSVSVGMPYLLNVPLNNTFVLSTNDGILANDSRKGHQLSFISFIENPTIAISPWTEEYNINDFRLCLFTEYQNNKRKSVHWYHKGINTSFGLTYEFAFIRYFLNSLYNSVKYIVPFKTNENGLTTASSDVDLEMNATYMWAVRQCSQVRCLHQVHSIKFQVDKIRPVGNILTSIMDVNNDAGCNKVTLKWAPFQGGSKIIFYQWVISKDADANLILTPWETKIANDSGLYKVTSCVVLPVYHYSTMYVCVRAFAESGNRGHICEILSYPSFGRYISSPVYDFDVHSDIWETVLEALSSSHLGQTYTDFHDNELNFGTASSRAAGVILYANERNVTWYLMLSKLVPDNCDQNKDCEAFEITSSGYVVFNQDSVSPNTIYYICAFSKATVVEREYFPETMDEINSCSDGFVIDTVAPKPGMVYVCSKHGFLTNLGGIEVTWDGFIENIDAVKFGFIDGIKKYSFAIGSRPNQDDIRNYTYVSLAKRTVVTDIKVTDGSVIYFSVKAEDHAGLTTTAVSNEYIVDTTPPHVGIISKTRDNIYRSTETYISSNTVTVSLEGFSDDESGIDFFEIGVGTRPYFSDVILLSRFDENNVVLHLGDTDLIDGHTYYIIARAVNHAGLTSPFAQIRMTVDRSPPTGGHLLEGHWTLENDTDHQSEVSSIHGHWKGFDDVHSGILYYRVGLGTQPYLDNIEPMFDVGLAEDQTWNNHFNVGQKYFITAEACNGAGLCQMRSSNGIVLDNSPPIRGLVRIGSDLFHQKYQSHLSSVHVHWAGFEDPQSGIDHYTMCVGKEKGKCNILPEFSCLLHSNIIKTGLNLPHQTDLYATVTAYNRVGMNVSKTSDAFRVDATPPVLIIKPHFLLDYNNVDSTMGQWEKSLLRIYWKFNDQESPIVSHDVSLITHHEGHTPVENLHLGPENEITINLNGNDWLHNGDRYIASVTSCNQAGLCTSASSDDLLIDSTPPHSGGFKQPMLWENLNDSLANLKSKLKLTWYGFFDQESGIRKYFLTVSHSYSGNELTDGEISFLPETNKSDQVHYVYLTDVIRANDLLFLTIWAENNVGLNSSVARVSVNALTSSKSVNVYQMKGSLELEKHSCDIHFCNKDCTCAVIGNPCVEVRTNRSCKQVNGELNDSGYPSYEVFGGLNKIPNYISATSACLSGRWNTKDQDNSSFAVKRFEWSAGIVNQPVGEGVYNLKLENPWQDIGVRNRFVHCLPTNKSILHAHEYIIYVRAWYSFEEYAVFESDPIMIDQTAPAVRRGQTVLDSDEICSSDFDIIDWMDTITACWNGVFNEQQGRITYYSVFLGTMPLADDIFTGTNVGLATNITLRNITLSQGTKYFFSVSAYNNIGLHTSSISDGFIIDMDNPTTGIVFNSLDHKDRLFQSSISNLSLSWYGFQDDFSGIRNYYAAIVDDPYHYSHVVNFTNVGLKTTFTSKNIELKHGKTYYGLVKARDNMGHVSNIAISKGVTIDTTPPKQYACQKYILTKQEIGQIQSNNNFLGVNVNLTMNTLYKISGNLTNILIYLPRLIIHIDRFHITIPVALNHRGVYIFEYKFLSLYTGVYNVTLEAYNIKDARVAMAISECDEIIEDDNASIEVRQISSKDVSVNVVILDKESQINKVLLGAGTNPGGFQIKALSPIHHRHHHGLVFTDAPHSSSVYVTVIAENQAGLRVIFKAEPIAIDHTAPVITTLQGSIERLQKNISGQLQYFTVVRAQWRVSDKESGIKFCFCSVGHEPDMHDVQETWHSQTDTSCESEMLMLQHGENVYLNVECVNNVELSSKTSTSLIASYAEPTAASATLQFIPVNGETSMYTSTVKDNLSVQSNRSCLRLEWNGFSDSSGISNYQFRILKGDEIFIDWTMTNQEMITIEETDLTDGHYMAEVRAINIGNRSSDVAKAELIVFGNPPELTGRSIVTSRQGRVLHLDWSGVFRTEPGVPLSYSVMIGTRPGYNDIVDLPYTSARRFDLKIPESTIITSSLKELFIRVICVYATGRRSEYATSYVIE